MQILLTPLLLLKGLTSEANAFFPSTHQSQPFNILVCGCRYDDFLPPVCAQEVLQVAPERLQAGELLREVDGSNGWMIAVFVQLLLEHFVDLVERAQEDLAETEDCWMETRRKECFPFSPHDLSVGVMSRTLYCGRVICPFW